MDHQEFRELAKKYSELMDLYMWAAHTNMPEAGALLLESVGLFQKMGALNLSPDDWNRISAEELTHLSCQQAMAKLAQRKNQDPQKDPTGIQPSSPI